MGARSVCFNANDVDTTVLLQCALAGLFGVMLATTVGGPLAGAIAAVTLFVLSPHAQTAVTCWCTLTAR